MILFCADSNTSAQTKNNELIANEPNTTNQNQLNEFLDQKVQRKLFMRQQEQIAPYLKAGLKTRDAHSFRATWASFASVSRPKTKYSSRQTILFIRPETTH